MEKPIFVIDGNRFNDLESLYDEVEHYLIPDVEWGRNLDSLNDMLRGNVGSLPRAYILVWKNMGKSRLDLGYEETIKFWHEVIKHWTTKEYLIQEEYNKLESENVKDKTMWNRMLGEARESILILNEKLEFSKLLQGETIFDWIMEMIIDERKEIEFRPE